MELLEYYIWQPRKHLHLYQNNRILEKWKQHVIFNEIIKIWCSFLKVDVGGDERQTID